jgi:hypothetical protein
MLAAELVATVSAFLTVGFCRWEKPTVNHRTIDRGYPFKRVNNLRDPSSSRSDRDSSG